MKPSLLKIVVCPLCQIELILRIDTRVGEEIEGGSLSCHQCGKTYPICHGIPRFVPTDDYAGNFSFEWNVHRKTQVDSISRHNESHNTFVEKTGLKEEELQGKLVLDVGCGTGRFMEIAAGFGATVVGIDLSYAVDAAYANMGSRPHIHIIQANLFHLPFRAETFDAIYSIGVLHHTRNTREAFLQLPRLLTKNGAIAIWVYMWAGEYSELVDRVRKWTVNIPQMLLYALCAAWIPIYYLFRQARWVGKYVRRIPVSNQGRGYVWDVLDTFDNYSPLYQWKHTSQEVRGWFEEAGLGQVVELSFPVSFRGVKGECEIRIPERSRAEGMLSSVCQPSSHR
jgi:SAM-dependent methyltransferase